MLHTVEYHTREAIENPQMSWFDEPNLDNKSIDILLGNLHCHTSMGLYRWDQFY